MNDAPQETHKWWANLLAGYAVACTAIVSAGAVFWMVALVAKAVS